MFNRGEKVSLAIVIIECVIIGVSTILVNRELKKEAALIIDERD